MEKRIEQEMMNIIFSIANQDERIRIVTIEGSPTNINIPKDEFQDYDITYFVRIWNRLYRMMFGLINLGIS